jgi:TolB-like protein
VDQRALVTVKDAICLPPVADFPPVVAYKHGAVDVKQVGAELGVRYVLEGSVRKGGNRVRINEQLIEAATGAHLWADRFDGTLEDVFDLQDADRKPQRPPIAETKPHGDSG